jgi:hypothetical protein
MECRARTLDRRFRPTRHLDQHFQGFDDGLLSDATAADRAEPLLAMGDAAVARRHREVNEPDRLAGRGAARACDSGDGHRQIDIGMFKRTEGHRDCDFLAHRAESFELDCFDAEHGVLGFVGIGDETAIDHVGRSGHFGQSCCDKAAGAGFSRCDLQLAHPAEIEEGAGQRPCGAVAHVSCPRSYRLPRAGGWWQQPWRQCLPDGR